MPNPDQLADLKRLATKRQTTQAAFEAAIRAASPEHSVRAIATAVGLSPARVHQIIQAAEATP